MWQFFKDMGRDVFAAQVLLNPQKADTKAFEIGWLKYYREKPFTRNYIFVDPANSKKEYADYTAMWVIGVDKRGYYFILDGIRDRLKIKERTRVLFRLVDKWNVNRVYYEKYGIQTDIDFIEEKQRDEGWFFRIEPVGGTKLSKEDRISLLQPLFQGGKIILPEKITYIDITGKKRNIVEEFINSEYLDYPSARHNDMLDCLARIRDEKVKIYKPVYYEPQPESAGVMFDIDFSEPKSKYDWAGI